MKKILLIMAISLSLTGCASTNRDQEKAELHLRIGTAHLNQGNYPLAMRELMEAYKLDPDNPMINNNLALAYFVRSKYAECEKYLRQAVSLDPNYTDAYNNLGRVHIEMGKYDEAVTELTKVVNDLTYPQPERGLANLGLAYFKKRNYPEAERKLKESLKNNNSFCPAHNYYGQALFQMKEYKKAAAAIETAVQVCKELDEAYYFGGLSYMKLGQKEKGLARMRELVELYPKSQYVPKARAYLNQEDKNGTDKP